MREIKAILTFIGISALMAMDAAYAADISPADEYAVANRHTNACLSIGATPSAAGCNSTSAQMWALIPVDAANGLYMIQSKATGQCLLSHKFEADGALAWNACNNSWWAAHWRLMSIDSVHFQIKSRHSEYCLNSARDYQNGQLHKIACNSAHWSQHWQLLKGPIREWSWSPHLASDCYLFNDYSYNGWYRFPSPLSPRCDLSTMNGKPLSWIIASHNEAFGTYTPGDIIPPSMIGDGKLLNFQFSSNPSMDNTYALDIALDKITHRAYNSDYTWVGFQDSFDQNWILPKLTLDKNLYVDFKMAVKVLQRIMDPSDGNIPGKTRVHIGLSAKMPRSDDKPFHFFIEVVTYRHPEFDGCTPTQNWWGRHPATVCDPSGLYDRRAFWGHGEAVYFYAPALHQVLGYYTPESQANSSHLTSYRIPISALMRSYGWQLSSIDWSKVTLAGIYIGIETIGSATTWIHLREYRLYEVK